MLKISNSNTKLAKLSKLIGKKVFSFSLRSGYTCPFAKECKSKVIETTDGLRIMDGPDTKFRCFSASQEVMYKNTYYARQQNEEQIRDCKTIPQTAKLIEESLPKKIDGNILRIHVAGDFLNQRYFDAWLRVAKNHPDTTFYAYTKSLPFWIKRLGKIPDNLVLTASYGGHKDELIKKHNLRYAKVVFSEQEAKDLGLEIDKDDSHAYDRTKKSFALLIHGTQPAKK
jgi:hypothetical protein